MGEREALILIIGGIVVAIFLVSGIGGFAFFRHKKKVLQEISEDNKRLQEDLVNNSQHPGKFPNN